MLSTVPPPSQENSFTLITLKGRCSIEDAGCEVSTRSATGAARTTASSLEYWKQNTRAESRSPCLQATKPRLLIDPQAKHIALIVSKSLDTAGGTQATYHPASPELRATGRELLFSETWTPAYQQQEAPHRRDETSSEVQWHKVVLPECDKSSGSTLTGGLRPSARQELRYSTPADHISENEVVMKSVKTNNDHVPPFEIFRMAHRSSHQAGLRRVHRSHEAHECGPTHFMIPPPTKMRAVVAEHLQTR
ncbi:hypothetical protein V8E53_008803 [Lactarius tabidus]